MRPLKNTATGVTIEEGVRLKRDEQAPQSRLSVMRSMRGKRDLKFWLGRIVLWVISVVLFLLVIYPFFWVLITSFKTEWAVLKDPAGFPWNPTIANYITVWTESAFATFFLNSVLITGCSLVGSVTVAALAAYAFSRFRFKGSDALFVLLLISLAIPTPSLMIAEYVLLSSVNLINTYQGIILLYMAWNAFAIILFRNAFRGIPQSLVDAAVIDGCGELRIFARIMLPLIKPTLATVTIFTFVWYWNDFVWPLVILHDPEKQTLIMGIYSTFVGDLWLSYNYVSAGLAMGMVPTLVVYLLLQRYFVAGMTLGGVKE